MKTDKYTKVVLTIIAICLINLSLGGISPFQQAYAGNTAPDGTYGLVPLNEDGSITVRLSNTEEIDVDITSISTWDELKVDIAEISTSDELKVDLSNISTSDELDINLDEVGGSNMTMGEAIPVKVKN
ncbi:MAG: hypothetical protein Roseis2KO_27790 [Roseivirga sp.]